MTITQVDGKVDVLELDPFESNPYLSIELTVPLPATPWVSETQQSRYGLTGVASIVLEDVEPDEAA